VSFIYNYQKANKTSNIMYNFLKKCIKITGLFPLKKTGLLYRYRLVGIALCVDLNVRVKDFLFNNLKMRH
jgi:hypothetical protein